MESFKTFLKDQVPGGTRNKPIRSLVWWNWANSPDSGSLTVGYGESGEFSKVTPIPLFYPMIINTCNTELR